MVNSVDNQNNMYEKINIEIAEVNQFVIHLTLKQWVFIKNNEESLKKKGYY